MASVQVGKAVSVKVSFASLGFKPRTFSNPGSCATNILLAKTLREAIPHCIQDLWPVQAGSGYPLRPCPCGSWTRMNVKFCQDFRREFVNLQMEQLQKPLHGGQAHVGLRSACNINREQVTIR